MDIYLLCEKEPVQRLWCHKYVYRARESKTLQIEVKDYLFRYNCIIHNQLTVFTEK